MWGDPHAWDMRKIVSGEGVYVGRSTRLGYEKEVVCIVSGGYRDDS